MRLCCSVAVTVLAASTARRRHRGLPRTTRPRRSCRCAPQPTAPTCPTWAAPPRTVLSKSDEYQLGRHGDAASCATRTSCSRIRRSASTSTASGMRLASQSADGGRSFQYFVIKDATINAFAVPGGFVVHQRRTGPRQPTTNRSSRASWRTRPRTSRSTTSRACSPTSRQQSLDHRGRHARRDPARRAGRRPGRSRAASPPPRGLRVQHQINFTRDNEWEADRVGIGFLAARRLRSRTGWATSSRP